MHCKNNDKFIYQEGEAHSTFLVSACSPVNCINCHGVDTASFIDVRRWRKAGASCFLLPRRMLQFTVMLVCSITFELLKIRRSCIKTSVVVKGTLSIREFTACGKVTAPHTSVVLLQVAGSSHVYWW